MWSFSLTGGRNEQNDIDNAHAEAGKAKEEVDRRVNLKDTLHRRLLRNQIVEM